MKALCEKYESSVPNFATMDFNDFAIAPLSVDVVICRDALHHATNLGRTLTQIHSVLKPGGLLIAREPYRGLFIPEQIALGDCSAHPTNESAPRLATWEKAFRFAGFKKEEWQLEGVVSKFLGKRKKDKYFQYSTAFFCNRISSRKKTVMSH